MSTRRLLQLLSQRGFSARTCSAALQDAYEDGCAEPILDWLAQNLGPANILTAQEAQQLAELDEAEEQQSQAGGSQDAPWPALQEGESALAILEHRPSPEQKRASLEAKQAELERLRGRLRELRAVKAEMAALRRSGEERGGVVRRGGGAAAAEDDGLERARGRLQEQNEAWNELMLTLQAAAERVAALQERSGGEWLLSLRGLEAYRAQDGAFQHELARFHQHQFQRGLAKTVSRQHASSSWLEAQDPSQPDALGRFLHGAGPELYQQRMAELQRLRWVAGLSRLQWLRAHAWQAKQAAALEAARLAEGRVAGMEAWVVEAEVRDAESQLAKLESRKAELLERLLPDLCTKLAQLQDTELLQSDYDLKLLRQDYYFGRKQHYLRLLAGQAAQHLLLDLARRREAALLARLHQVVVSTQQSISAAGQAAAARMAGYDRAAEEREPRLTLRDRDTFLHTLFELLDPTDAELEDDDTAGAPRTYVRCSSLLSRVDAHAARAEAAQHSAQDVATALLRGPAERLRECFRRLHGLLFPPGSAGRLVLTPPQLAAALSAAEDAVGQLSKATEAAVGQASMYEAALKQHARQLSLERSVFVQFHTNPAALSARLAALEAATQALA